MSAMTASDLHSESFVSQNDTSDENIDVTINSEETVSSPDKSVNSAPDSEGYHSRISDIDTTRNNNNDCDKTDGNISIGSPISKDHEQSETNGSDYDSGDDRNLNDDFDGKCTSSPQSKASGDDGTPYNWYSTVEAKKARVENIITSMRHYPTDYNMDTHNNNSVDRGRKRKQFHPQQHEPTSPQIKQPTAENMFLHAHIRDLHNKLQFIHQRMYTDEGESAEFQTHNRAYQNEIANRSALYGLINRTHMQNETKIANEDLSPGKLSAESYEQFKLSNKETTQTNSTKACFSPPKKKFKFSDDPKVIDDTCADLKRRISRAVSSVLDDFNKDLTEYQKTLKEELKKARESRHELNNENLYKPLHFPFYNRQDDLNLLSSRHSDNPLRNLVDSLNRSQVHHPLASYPPFPAYYRYLPTLPGMMPPPPPPFQTQTTPQPPEPEQTEALSLVVSTPKKKRTKVTDTRLSPRAARALLQDVKPDLPSDSRAFNIYPSLSPNIPQCLPTSVAIANPGLQNSEFLRYINDESPLNDSTSSISGKLSPLQADQGSPGASNVTSSECAKLSNLSFNHFDSHSLDASPFYPHMALQYTNTLTPMHLRKAKLMFFFCPYPSSSVLKTYFPDIRFNKNNTAQLVKWFSNFREFFYIQMEKYARQGLADGVKNPGELFVSIESEIYRVLNLHYNRNNQLQVPDKFRQVVEIALREFFVAILNGKDTEQPWKKTIYKVIQRLDEKLPDIFLSPNWMDLIGEA